MTSTRKTGGALQGKRVGFLVLFFVVWAGLIAYRLYDLQVQQRPFLLAKKTEQQKGLIKLIPQRGKIFDRNGRILAMSLDVDSIYAVPYEIEKPHETSRIIAKKLNMKYREVLRKISSNKSFVWLKRKVEPRDAIRVREAGLNGIYTYKENKRYYPYNTLLSGALGFAGIDNDGLSGIEYEYDSVLKGKPGAILTLKDARRKQITTGQLIKSVPTKGKSIYLTIDSNLQYYLEKYLFEASRRHRVKQSFGVMMNPYTGDILAIASYPTFDLNEYFNYGQVYYKNRPVQVAYEPGSTFKLVTAAAALEEGVISPSSKIFCENGKLKIRTREIGDYKPFGTLSFEDVLVYSSNIGMVKVSRKLGAEKFYAKLRQYGFGGETGVHFPGENPGILRPLKKWTSESLPSISFGQEISVNSIQLLSFICAIANGGYEVKPRILSGVAEPEFIRDARGERLIGERVQKTLKEIMTEVVKRGTGRKAAVPGYTVAGKTGTAQKAGKTGKYLENKYMSSFVGFAPAEKPEIALLLVFDEPEGLQDGGDVAAPVFAQIAADTLKYMQIPKKQRNPLYYIPDTNGYTENIEFLLTSFQAAGYNYNESKAANSPYALDLANEEDSTGKIRMPDLSGKSYREAFEIVTKLGLRPRFFGSGRVIFQSPVRNATVDTGSFCTVHFQRKEG